jgi:prepilin-type N-terminal cleavage/methylation domain-containing protein
LPRRGFTLLELIVVVVVVGLLGLLSISTYTAVINRAKDASALATTAALLREAGALAAMRGDTVFTAQDLTDAVADLPAVGTSGVSATSWTLLTGEDEHSDTYGTIHALLSPDASTAGAAMMTASGRCAVARGGLTGEIESWLSDTDPEGYCTGAMALAGPEPPPPATTTTTTTAPPPPVCVAPGVSTTADLYAGSPPTFTGGLASPVVLPPRGLDGPVSSATFDKSLPAGTAVEVGALVEDRSAGVLNTALYATSSSSVNGTLVPFNALNRDNVAGGVSDSGRFHTLNGANEYLQVDLGPGRYAAVSSYAVRTANQNQYPTFAGKTMQIQGSNDATNWTGIYSHTPAVTAAGGNWATYSFTQSAAYRYFRLATSASNYLILDEFELFGHVTAPSYSVVPGTVLPAPSTNAATTGAAVLAKTAGILNSIGSEPGAWQNPLGLLGKSYRSTALEPSLPSVLTNRSGTGATGANRFHSVQTSDPYVTIDLGATRRAQVSSYAIGTADNPLAGVKLEGSLDNSSWSTIDSRTTINSQASNTWKLYNANGPAADVAGAYRYFRLTSTGNVYQILDELELFGNLYRANAYTVDTSSGGTFIDATPATPATTVMDQTSGILNRFGSSSGTWSNPILSLVSGSGTAMLDVNSTYAKLANRSLAVSFSERFHTTAATNSNFVLDLGASRRAQVSSYSVRTATWNQFPADASGTVDQRARQGWTLYGSNDNSSWSVIDARQVIQPAASWGTYTSNGDPSDVAAGYRYLKVVSDEPASSYIILDEFEVHGVGWSQPPAPPANVTLSVLGGTWTASFDSVVGAVGYHVQVADAAGILVYDAPASSGVSQTPVTVPSGYKLRVAPTTFFGVGAYSNWTSVVNTCPGS